MVAEFSTVKSLATINSKKQLYSFKFLPFRSLPYAPLPHVPSPFRLILPPLRRKAERHIELMSGATKEKLA